MKKVKIEKSLKQLENLMNDQGVTLFNSNGDYKNFEKAFKDILTAYERAFTRDRIRDRILRAKSSLMKMD